MSLPLAMPDIDPFGPAVNPAAYVPAAATERALAALATSVSEGRGVAALLGPPGLGKTLVLRLLGAREVRLSAVYVPFCSLAPDELCTLALDAFGESPDGDPVEGLLARARDLGARGSGLLLLIDDAGSLPDATAATLARLVEQADPILRIVLAGVDGPETRRSLGAFGEVDLIRLTQGLSADEARLYVGRRLELAQAAPILGGLFSDEMVGELHRVAEGNPRELNRAAQTLIRGMAEDDAPKLRALATQTRVLPAPPSDVAAAETLARLAPTRVPFAKRAPANESGEPVAPSGSGAARAPLEAGAYRYVRGKLVDPRTNEPVDPVAPVAAGSAPEAAPRNVPAPEPAVEVGPESDDTVRTVEIPALEIPPPLPTREPASPPVASSHFGTPSQRRAAAAVLLAAASLLVGVWVGRNVGSTASAPTLAELAPALEAAVTPNELDPEPAVPELGAFTRARRAPAPEPTEPAVVTTGEAAPPRPTVVSEARQVARRPAVTQETAPIPSPPEPRRASVPTQDPVPRPVRPAADPLPESPLAGEAPPPLAPPAPEPALEPALERREAAAPSPRAPQSFEAEGLRAPATFERVEVEEAAPAPDIGGDPTRAIERVETAGVPPVTPRAPPEPDVEPDAEEELATRDLPEPARAASPAVEPPRATASVPRTQPSSEPGPEAEPTFGPAAPSAPAAGASRFVGVSIDADPDTVVEIDGVEIGVAPIARIELSTGPHTFRALLSDGRVLETTIEIDANQRSVVLE